MKIIFLRDTELKAYSYRSNEFSTVTFEKGEEVEVNSIKYSKNFADMYSIILLDGRETSDIKENIEILS